MIPYIKKIYKKLYNSKTRTNLAFINENKNLVTKLNGTHNLNVLYIDIC